MQAKVQEKNKAIKLRKKGYSYKDILREVPVAKSTLSNWLKDLPLTKREKEYLKTRRNKNISRGRIKAATANRENRIERDKQLFQNAKEEFSKFEESAFFQTGVALYWAEGSKKSHSFQFINSDADMIKLMINWIEEFLKTPKENLSYRLYIHKPYAHENCEEYWSDVVGVSSSIFKKTIYKPTRHLHKKNPAYKGCLRITIPKGKKILIKMIAWQNSLIDKYLNT